MNRIEICQEFEKEFLSECLPAYRWQTLLDRLAGDPHTRIPHHEKCLVRLTSNPYDCPHCVQLYRAEEGIPA